MHDLGTRLHARSGARAVRVPRPSLIAVARLGIMLAALGFVGSQVVAQSSGTMSFDPPSGTVGTDVTVTLAGLTPGAEVDVVWTSAEADWNVGDGRFYGVVATDTRAVVATAHVGADGTASATFTVPEDYGYVHNVFAESGGEQVARQGFVVAPHMTIEPASGPVGTPITVTLTGAGYRFWEMVWQLAYDGAHTGWLSAITTQGTAKVVIPATGEVGMHTLQAISGTHPVPYLNQQQSPNYKPAVPTVLGAVFEVTDGPAVAWSAPAEQTLPRNPGAPLRDGQGPRVTTDFASGPVGSPMTVTGAGFAPGAEVAIGWSSVRGNRISGAGWEEVERELGTATVDASGAFAFTTDTPDDLGGAHRVTVVAGDDSAETSYVITPSVSLVTPQVVEPGGDIQLTIKGIGWTETANIIALLLDNGYLGYGCGFNSQGDVTIHLKAPGREGVHFISLYPSIYQGQVAGPGAPASPDANATYLQLPMLNHIDHPGEELPAFHLSFEVRR
jgi:hypothetical protein